MKTDRRGFLAALLAAPVLARIAPAAIPPPVGGLEDFITANLWDVGPSLTEAGFIRFLEEGMRPRPWPRSSYTFEWLEKDELSARGLRSLDEA